MSSTPSDLSKSKLSPSAMVGGLAASAAATALSAMVHTIVPSVPFPPASIAQILVRTTSGEVNSFFIGYLGHWALRLAVLGVAIAFALSGMVFGWLVARRKSRRLWAGAALPLWLAAITLYPEVPQHLSRELFAAVSLPVHIAAGLIGGYVATRVARESEEVTVVEEDIPLPRRMPGEPQPTRRYFLVALGVGGAGIALGLANLGSRLRDPGERLLTLARLNKAPRRSSAVGDAAFADVAGLTPEVTSNAEHYVVDEEIFDPVIDPAEWTLKITGVVDREVVLTYDDLLRLEAEERYQTLLCVSNEVGGHLISTAKWTGVPLNGLLDRAGVGSDAVEVVFKAVGGYSDSLDVDQAMDDSTLIAIGMNDHVLPRAHGFPARLLSTGTYGYKNPKWLNEIVVVDSPYKGFWQHRGWDKAGKIKTMSRIDVPEPGPVDRPVTVAGIAFAADRGISKVEVSSDGGRTWDRARLKSELSPVAWRLWLIEWEAPSSGEHELLVRATDGGGAVQISRHASPFPDGSSGYDSVTVTVPA
ncbi:MAG: molybdopterin-dependent oxidoreductase [Actinobacteria bacterium]|nr:molybdopterin-dependent oxidoreductase [Actinomycetota bacterium]